MPVKFTVSTTAYTYLASLPPHMYRKHNQAYFSYNHIVSDYQKRIATGLAKFLEQFLLLKHIPDLSQYQNFNQYQQKVMWRNFGFPTNFPTVPAASTYHTKQPNTSHYYITPQSFYDARPPELKYFTTQLNFVPGDPPPINTRGNYPLWTPNMDETKRLLNLNFDYPTLVLDCLAQIAFYWHIPTVTGRRPNNKTMAASAALNAIGVRYLQHDLLPPEYKVSRSYIQ